MKENEKARPDGATSGQAEETVLQDSDTVSAHNSSIGAGRGQAGIVDLLQRGEADAIPARDLAAEIGVSERRLRAIIDAEREAGAVILASDAGYFLLAVDPAEALAEARRFCARQDSRLRSNRRASDSARRMLAQLELDMSGQLRVEVDDAGA